MDEYDLELEDLRDQQESADRKKGYLNVAGSVLKNFSDIPSSYEMLYNKKIARQDPREVMSQAASMIKDPMDQSRKAMEYVAQKRGLNKMKMEDAAVASKKDPNSKQSMALKALAPRWGIAVSPEMSAFDIEQMIDPKKMMETEARSQVDFDKAKRLAQMQHGFDMQKEKAKLAEKAALDAKGQKLPADKVLKVNEGNAIPKMLEDIDQTISSNEMAFGPILGRIRAANPYDETAQAVQSQTRAASQAFGRFMEGGVLRKEDEEKYRKMFPNNSDTPETARNKLAIVRKLLVDKQKSDLAALQNSGYDVSGFNAKLPEAANPAVLSGGTPRDEKSKQAVEWAMANPQDPRSKQILEFHGVTPNAVADR